MRLLLLLLGLSSTLPGCASPDAIVAGDGSGNYTTLQAAIDAAPARGASTARWEILIKPGAYRERVHLPRGRNRLFIHGNDAATTTLTFNLNAKLPDPANPTKPLGTFRTPTVWIESDDVILENLTLANTAGNVGQALALRADGDRLAFRRCRFLGWQDTVLVNRGRDFFDDCYIEGHVDFIFGAATAYFSHCQIHCLGSGYITAAATPEGTAHGFVFADCRITADAKVLSYLGRPWRPFARVAFLRTDMCAAIRPQGWNNWSKPDAEKSTFCAESASTGPGANPHARVPWSHQLSQDEAAAITSAAVLGGADHWNPEK